MKKRMQVEFCQPLNLGWVISAKASTLEVNGILEDITIDIRLADIDGANHLAASTGRGELEELLDNLSEFLSELPKLPTPPPF